MLEDDLRAILVGPADVVAQQILGWVIKHSGPDGEVAIELTEVEAYAGQADPASHAWRGRTARNAVMFGPAGSLYVYLSHGLHACVNVVTGPVGTAAAVLLRAGRVTQGLELARLRRSGVPDVSLARGPGNLGKALGLTTVVSGADLLTSPSLSLRPPSRTTQETELSICCGPRVGVSRAAEVAWRYWIDNDPTVSAYRRSQRVAR